MRDYWLTRSKPYEEGFIILDDDVASLRINSKMIVILVIRFKSYLITINFAQEFNENLFANISTVTKFG